MIDKQILKKHNLKAVPFSHIGEGETFNVLDDLLHEDPELLEYQRRLVAGRIVWADGFNSPIAANLDWYTSINRTVYVPVCRPCKEGAK